MKDGGFRAQVPEFYLATGFTRKPGQQKGSARRRHGCASSSNGPSETPEPLQEHRSTSFGLSLSIAHGALKNIVEHFFDFAETESGIQNLESCSRMSQAHSPSHQGLCSAASRHLACLGRTGPHHLGVLGFGLGSAGHLAVGVVP